MTTTVGSTRTIRFEVRLMDARGDWWPQFRSPSYDNALNSLMKFVRLGGIGVVDEVDKDDPSYRYEMVRVTVELG